MFFGFYIPTILGSHIDPGVLYKSGSLFLLKINKLSLLGRVVSTRKAFSVCQTFGTDAGKPFLGMLRKVNAGIVWCKIIFLYCFKNKRNHYNALIRSQWSAYATNLASYYGVRLFLTLRSKLKYKLMYLPISAKYNVCCKLFAPVRLLELT